VYSAQVLTLEDWEYIMNDVWSASGQASTTLFFLVWVVVGKYTLLSLFLAVIMEAFEQAQDRQDLAQQDCDPSDAELTAMAQKLETRLPPVEGGLPVNGVYLLLRGLCYVVADRRVNACVQTHDMDMSPHCMPL
jgi:hypothetical protein